MQKIKITNAERFDSIPDNETVIDVSFDVVEVNEAGEETVIESLRESFSLKSTQEDIENHLQKRLSTYKLDKEQAEIQEDLDTTLQKADETIESLVGAEVLSVEKVKTE